jgi:hypothetical protein
MTSSAEWDLAQHLADPHDWEVEFRRLCAKQGIDPEQFRAAWAAGEIDPDAGYDPNSPYFGKDVATLGMLLPTPLSQHARRA